jgi:hypothetical protein
VCVYVYVYVYVNVCVCIYVYVCLVVLKYIYMHIIHSIYLNSSIQITAIPETIIQLRLHEGHLTCASLLPLLQQGYEALPHQSL